jgi:hypothetical protein
MGGNTITSYGSTPAVSFEQHLVELNVMPSCRRPMTLYAKRKAGFHNMRPERARALSCRGTRTVVELANDYAHTYAPFIRAAVREVGHNYRQVAIDSPGSDSSSSTLEGSVAPERGAT